MGNGAGKAHVHGLVHGQGACASMGTGVGPSAWAGALVSASVCGRRKCMGGPRCAWAGASASTMGPEHGCGANLHRLSHKCMGRCTGRANRDVCAGARGKHGTGGCMGSSRGWANVTRPGAGAQPGAP